ncbi:MAG: thymidine phosphorylase [Caldilineaceae bacterium]|nr:thymidine phosphorylase [Caldilineaceae bacterium]
MMNAVDLITKKRDGGEHSADELEFLMRGIVQETIPEYQIAAWAMAVYFRGMTAAESTALTLAMAGSGETLDLRELAGSGKLIVDKHSSGGVGDKTTLTVGPIVAACGLPVGKMSGRGLSFSGGTIDKLEGIPGWSAGLSTAQFRRQLREVGLVVAAQTATLAPADQKLYALRDVTGTVPSLPLIAGSIMSKKLAAGADAIVLDVKCGRGAFMESLTEAKELAELMVSIGKGAGRRVTALVTAMDQPLGRAVGNILEVREAIDTLQGGGPPDFQQLTQEVASEMLLLGDPGFFGEQEAAGDEAGREAARHRVQEALASGAAFEKFVQFVAAQGGDAAAVVSPWRLASAPVTVELRAKEEGVVTGLDARAVGLAVVALGGGRQRKGDEIDHRVGVVLNSKVGDRVANGDLLCTVHAGDTKAAGLAADRVLNAYSLADIHGLEPVDPNAGKVWRGARDEVDAAAEGQEPSIVLDRITS